MSAEAFAAIAASYQRLFADAPRPGDAKAVLDDLKGFCFGFDHFDTSATITAHNLGRLRVWQRIERALKPIAEPPPADDGRHTVFGDVEGQELAPGPLGTEGE